MQISDKPEQAAVEADADEGATAARPKESLLRQKAEQLKTRGEATENEKLVAEELEITKLLNKQNQALKAAKELAKDVVYTEPMRTGWKPPVKYRCGLCQALRRSPLGCRCGHGARRQLWGACWRGWRGCCCCWGGQGGVGTAQSGGLRLDARLCSPRGAPDAAALLGELWGAVPGARSSRRCAAAALQTGRQLQGRRAPVAARALPLRPLRCRGAPPPPPTPPPPPPPARRQMSERARQELRDATFISCEGSNLPPPIAHFEEMKLPKGILRHLAAKNISKPSPIQMQGLPVALAGRCGAAPLVPRCLGAAAAVVAAADDGVAMGMFLGPPPSLNSAPRLARLPWTPPLDPPPP
jgi:hypothetical protein